MSDPTTSPTMASQSPRDFFRQPLALALSFLAALLFVLAIWALISRGSMRSQLESEQTQRVALAQNLADLQSRVGSAEALSKTAEQAKSDLAKLETARSTAEQQFLVAEKNLQAVQARIATLEEERIGLAAKNAEHERAIGESEKRRQALAAELSDLDKSLSTRSNEVAEVGKRLLAAREDEAQLRAAVGQLNNEAAARAEEAAQAERRIQEARKIEAQAQEQLSFVRTQLSELEQRLETLTREFSKRSEEISPNARGETRSASPPPPAPQPAPVPDTSVAPPSPAPPQQQQIVE